MHTHSLKDVFESSFAGRCDKLAITFFRYGTGETILTYGQMDQDANRLAHVFLESGVEKGDRVILFIRKSLIAVVAHIALYKIGAVAIPLNPGFKKSEMEYLLQDADAALVLTEPEKIALINEIDPDQKTLAVSSDKPYQDLDFFKSFSKSALQVDIQADDPGLIIYTSGTTGKPKGTILTQQNLIHDARNVIDIWEISDSDVLCHALPLFHVHGLCFALHTALISGAYVLMLDRFDPAVVLNSLSRTDADHVCTVFMAVPAMYAKMIDCLDDTDENDSDFSHLRLLTSGSAPLLVKDFERIQTVFGVAPVEREGMTETGMNFSNPVKGRRKPGSIGVPLPDLKVRIVDPGSFKDLHSRDIGEIWLKGPGITPGYWRKPQETEETFVDGWFRTGDLGRMDHEGYYYLTDRIKHIIISGGENVSAKEVETVINTLEEVVESTVVGIPDKKWGEKVAAAVVIKPGACLTVEDVQIQCKQNLHKWKRPKEIILVNQLPKNTMGKILKEEVKNLFA